MSSFAEDYKASTETFVALVRSLSASDLDKSDHEGWTPRQVIHHMADSEAQSYARLRRLIAEPGTTIQGYDEGKWAENPTLAYKSAEIDSALAVVIAVREASYVLLTRVSDDQLNNAGVHTESGAYTINDWLKSYTNHPVDHAKQIKNQIN